MMRSLALSLVLLLPATAGWCGDNGWQSPVLGYLVTQDPLELRPISGIPGAAVRGEPLPLPEGLTALRLAPGPRYALAERGDPIPPAVLLLDGGTPAVLPLEGVLTGAGLVAFSPSATSAALYSARERRLQVLAGLPSRPQIVRDLPWNEPAALAVSDDAQSLLASDASGTVSLLAADGGTQFLFRAREPGALAFLPNRADALILDRDEVYLLGGLDGAVSSRLLASGLERPAELLAAAGGKSALVTDRDGLRVWWIDIASATLQAVDVPAGPLRLEPLRLADAFLISAEPGEPAWLLVRGGAQMRSYFIPAAQAEGRDSQ
ncbi:MAG: hypothetical protein HY822_15120 [Acidobacteria bacterium]|nr:hypothetical protein [Acidobacteriota bacterium]